MPEWSRDITWRQGMMLTDATATQLGLLHPGFPDKTVAVVASHDCDLAQSPDKEPFVEVIVGRQIEKMEGNFTNSKTARTLHISFEGKEALLAEFVITDKHPVNKLELSKYLPDTEHQLTPPDFNTFQIWLALRYRRSAFPDEFDHRLESSGLVKKISNSAKKFGSTITAIFFDVDEGRDERKGETDLYLLDIYLLYATAPDPDTALEEANKLKEEIEKAFQNKLYDKTKKNWTSIELRSTEAVSEDAFSFYQSKVLKKRQLDHISLAADPQQEILD